MRRAVNFAGDRRLLARAAGAGAGTLTDQSVYRRYTDFSRGVLDTGNLIFFLVGTALFLFLTIKVMESRRWK